MAYPGQVLHNPASGERITFRETAAQTEGELLAIDLQLPPGGRVPGGLHRHPRQEERFEVVSGRMRFRSGRKTIVAGPGETVVVPAGVRHDFANAGHEEALVRVEVRPALNMERLFEVAVALAEQKRTLPGGIPSRSTSRSSCVSSSRRCRASSRPSGFSGCCLPAGLDRQAPQERAA